MAKQSLNFGGNAGGCLAGVPRALLLLHHRACRSTGSSLQQLQAGVHPWRMQLSPSWAGEVGKGSRRGVLAARASPDKLCEAELIRGGDGPATSGNSFRVFLA